jgi:hypothetical protein
LRDHVKGLVRSTGWGLSVGYLLSLPHPRCPTSCQDSPSCASSSQTRRKALQALRPARPPHARNPCGRTSMAPPMQTQWRRKTAQTRPILDLSVKRAREKRDDARRQLYDGVDPR